MAIKGKGSKAPQSKLTKMQFTKGEFPTAKSVKDYLAANNIEGAGAVTDGDDVWIVKSTEDLSAVTLGKARSTATKHKGVTAFIAPVTGTEAATETAAKGGAPEGDEDDQSTDDTDETGDDDTDEAEGDDEDEAPPVAKASSKVKQIAGADTKVRRLPAPKVAAAAGPEDEEDDEPVSPVLELSEKYDWWGAYSSGEDSLLGVLKDGMNYDNVPPGMEDVMMAAYITIGNVLSNDDTSANKLNALKQMGNELATITVGLFDLFSQATDDATKSLKPTVRKSAKAFSTSFAESVMRMAEGDLSVIANVDNEAAPAASVKEVAAAATVALPKELTDTLAGIAKGLKGITARQDRVESELSRAPVQRSMSDSMSELVDEDDLENDDEDDVDAKARVEEVRRSFGLRPTTIAA